jgi:thymidylate synthase ThyX
MSIVLLHISYREDNFILAHSLCTAENYYFNLLEAGWKPQQARAVLPNSLKTELMMTGFVSDWKHFLN